MSVCIKAATSEALLSVLATSRGGAAISFHQSSSLRRRYERKQSTWEVVFSIATLSILMQFAARGSLDARGITCPSYVDQTLRSMEEATFDTLTLPLGLQRRPPSSSVSTSLQTYASRLLPPRVSVLATSRGGACDNDLSIVVGASSMNTHGSRLIHRYHFCINSLNRRSSCNTHGLYRNDVSAATNVENESCVDSVDSLTSVDFTVATCSCSKLDSSATDRFVIASFSTVSFLVDHA